jgi:bacterioferritin (cytochrome b1)
MKSFIKLQNREYFDDNMVDLIDLLNQAFDKELSTALIYLWQYLYMESSDIKDSFKENATEKIKQAIEIGEQLFNLGEFPASTPENIEKPLKEMIDLNLKSENDLIKIYQEIIQLASKEKDTVTQSLAEKNLTEEKERKRILMCARGRAATKLI